MPPDFIRAARRGRGAYLRDWIGPDAYRALQGIWATFDASGHCNPGKLVSNDAPIMSIATTPFRAFNAPEGGPLTRAFRCNGHARERSDGRA